MTPIRWCSHPSQNEMSLSVEKCDWNLLLYNFPSESSGSQQIWIMELGHIWMKERNREKGNVFVEREVFLLRQSGALFRRSHTPKSPEWESPPLPQTSLHLWKRHFWKVLTEGPNSVIDQSSFISTVKVLLSLYPYYSEMKNSRVFYCLQTCAIKVTHKMQDVA